MGSGGEVEIKEGERSKKAQPPPMSATEKSTEGEGEGEETSCGVAPTAEAAEQVLKSTTCYERPKSAVRFFRWAKASVQLTPLAWNLLVDILGKAAMFDPMWDAVLSMSQEGGLLSVATFASMFASYCARGNFKEAAMAFDVMERHGVTPDAVALNSLLAAMCRRDGGGQAAWELFERYKTTVAPDADTFAILLEAWEKEGNVQRAKSTFGEMVVRVGWDASNMPAYDAFLSTLVRGDQFNEALKFLQGLIKQRKARETEGFLAEMSKNEQLPSASNCAAAISLFSQEFNPSAAVDVWHCIVEHQITPAEESAKELIAGLLDFSRFAESTAQSILHMDLSSHTDVSDMDSKMFEALSAMLGMNLESLARKKHNTKQKAQAAAPLASVHAMLIPALARDPHASSPAGLAETAPASRPRKKNNKEGGSLPSLPVAPECRQGKDRDGGINVNGGPQAPRYTRVRQGVPGVPRCLVPSSELALVKAQQRLQEEGCVVDISSRLSTTMEAMDQRGNSPPI
ncbi:hypothetical protein TRIUR3_28674 [Triticum urartu]|uniref:Pentatricopeptide repeat-containing protein-mitochondrial domain-containing protein n=1 Tax=Triticum urartu TaxID=4572 RepID=M8A3L6_TRIUA|nr:hypothetical protein TRIUR3_28674 [Triticum urartu]